MILTHSLEMMNSMKTIELNEQQIDILKYFLEEILKNPENNSQYTTVITQQIINKLEAE